jgi:hypothetical protein
MDNYVRPHFQQTELEALAQCVNCPIQSVFYYNWINTSAEKAFQFVYAVELNFKNNFSLLITSGDPDETPKLCFNAVDIAMEKMDVDNSFNGLLTIESEEVTQKEPWSEWVGKEIDLVELDFDKEKKLYFADYMMLKQADNYLLIRTGQSGDGVDVMIIDKDQMQSK